MKVVTTVADVRAARRALPGEVGFVPTMGALHAGHLALVRAAREENTSVVASIFVNPLQFGPAEDYQTYPRNLDHDVTLLEGAGVDLVFAPTLSEMYPPDFTTDVRVGPIAERLEGAHRPGHFRGVSTVVARLFNLVGPDRAYFGQKDAQQCVVVRKLVRDLGFPVEIVVVPTVREADGLALSSRNMYLSDRERVAAVALSRGLRAAEARYREGERNADVLRQIVRARVNAEPRVDLEYVSVAGSDNLDELESIDRPAILSLAARVGKTRLIDNVVLD